MLTNVTLVNGEQIAATKPYHIVENGDFRVGFISIAEVDWIATLAAFDEDDIHFEDIVESSEKWAKILSNLISFIIIFLKERNIIVISLLL